MVQTLFYKLLLGGSMRLLVCFFCLLFVASCSTPVRVAIPNISTPSVTEKLPGKYAIFLQRGGWQLTAEATSWTCTAQEFEVPVDQPYEHSIRKVVRETFEAVDYVDAALSPEALANGNYAGQVVIIQSGADAFFNVRNRFISYVVDSEVRVNTVTSVSLVNGTQSQFSSSGVGQGQVDLYVGCSVAGDAVSMAAQNAVQTLVNSMSTQLQAALVKPGD